MAAGFSEKNAVYDGRLSEKNAVYDRRPFREERSAVIDRRYSGASPYSVILHRRNDGRNAAV